MGLNRIAKRRDKNEPPIIDALEKVGAEVWPVDRPCDLIVWFRRTWHLLEVKMPNGRLSVRQAADREQGLCEGIQTVRTPLEALQAIGAIR